MARVRSPLLTTRVVSQVWENHVNNVNEGLEGITVRVTCHVCVEGEKVLKGEEEIESGGWHSVIVEGVVNRRGDGEVEWKVVDFDNILGGNYFG